MKKLVWAVLPLLAACAHEVPLTAQTGGSEVMTSKVSKHPAQVIVSQDILGAAPVVKPGYLCGAHSYPLNIGPIITQSLQRTLESAFSRVEVSPTPVATAPDAVVFKFDLESLDPRVRFIPGFWSGTADSSVDIGIRVHVTKADGSELITSIFRGQGHDTEDGACPVGAQSLERASEQAIRSAMENLVDKVINTDALKAVQ
jgi:hypothetical protein